MSIALESLAEGEPLRGFTPRAVYLDDAGRRVGARLCHAATGFVLDYLRIESAPQAFLWVGTFPTSDQGEPHTQEHLLLGKGNKGRHVASLEAMSLARSSAFTMQWRTCYHFHTTAGPQEFWRVLDARLDALLNPDYTDEEIRREVRNFGISADASGALRLEEQGTVYNEMVRSFESPFVLTFHEAGRLLYGDRHPLALSSGGLPGAIREMSAGDIRSFHHDHYHLANMGMVGAFPADVPLDEVLDQTSAILGPLAGRGGEVTTEGDLPPPAGREPGSITAVDYPHASERQPSPMFFVWPATRDLAIPDKLLLELFLSAFAGDEGTNLYRKLVDGQTRVLDLGATGVWSFVDDDLGQPVFVGLQNVQAPHLTAERAAEVRAVIREELARVAELAPASPELAALTGRIQSRVTQVRRTLSKLLNSPPGFGYRGAGASWMMHLHELQKAPGFEKPVTLGPAVDYVEEVLARPENVWGEALERWGLLETEPHAVFARPSPEERGRLDREREARLAAEVDRLIARYGARDGDEALRRYKADYDRRTAELEAAEQRVELPPLTDAPPMTLDDRLDYRVDRVRGIERVASTFENMTGVTTGLAFRLDAVSDRRLLYLGLLPRLMTEVGLYAGGRAISHDEMKERMRREILDLSVHFSVNLATGRAELALSGTGNDLAESRRALEWMRRVMEGPDWRPENLARIRDVVDQAVTRLRQRMLGPEEGWVRDPVNLYWRQDDRILRRTSSFLTISHDAHRLRWMLMDPGEEREAADRLFEELAAAGEELSREELAARAAALGGDEPARISRAAGEDLGQLLGELPDGSLAGDWRYLCDQMRRDLATPPGDVLEELRALKGEILRRSAARLWTAGARDVQRELEPAVAELAGSLPEARLEDRPRRANDLVRDQLRDRLPDAEPLFLGLVNPNTSGGVFVHSAPGTSYRDEGEEALLDYLASNLYTGQGAHTIFMKTWGAGLAYSNGLRSSLASGRLLYYAERCPELPQTIRFVIDELRRAEPQPALADYALAQAFTSRLAAGYEGRAAAMASDLADGLNPSVVRRCRESLLALRDRPDLAEALFARMERVYGRVLPGYGPPSSRVPGAVYFVIGPESQLAPYEAYLREVEGEDAVLYRLYPRDFWVTA